MHALSLNKIEAGVNKKRVGKIKLHFPDPVKLITYDAASFYP